MNNYEPNVGNFSYWSLTTLSWYLWCTEATFRYAISIVYILSCVRKRPEYRWAEFARMMGINWAINSKRPLVIVRTISSNRCLALKPKQFEHRLLRKHKILITVIKFCRHKKNAELKSSPPGNVLFLSNHILKYQLPTDRLSYR